MSRGTLYVRFPDGTIRYGIYNGTCDIAQPPLFDTVAQGWDWWFNRTPREAVWDFDDGAGEPVDVATNYGSGFGWPATATHSHLTSGHEPLGADTSWLERSASIATSEDTMPDWALEHDRRLSAPDKHPGPVNCTTDAPQWNVSHLIVANLVEGDLAICGQVLNVRDHPSKHVDCTCVKPWPRCEGCVSTKGA